MGFFESLKDFVVFLRFSRFLGFLKICEIFYKSARDFWSDLHLDMGLTLSYVKSLELYCPGQYEAAADGRRSSALVFNT